MFFDGSFSKSGSTSLASCHRPNKVLSDIWRPSRADERRNAPSLTNVAGLLVILWDGSLKAREEQAVQPWKRGDMGITLDVAERWLRNSPEYNELFRVHKGRVVSVTAMAEAIVRYQRNLILRGGDPRVLRPTAYDGWLLFNQRPGCMTCQTMQPEFRQGAPLMLSGFRFHNAGVGYNGHGRGASQRDLGRREHTRDKADTGAYGTLPPRNLSLTTPYIQGGSLATLEDAVKFDDRGRWRGDAISLRRRPERPHDLLTWASGPISAFVHHG
jgi:cytochrome c peroxidase